MNYEQKYKELVGKIKNAYLYAQTDSTKNVLEDIFPELKESEEDKIRKALIDFFSAGAYNGEQTNGVYDKDIIDWIEKQGEQKEYTFKSLPRLLDMIEPTDRAKSYCQKLMEALLKEGYTTDAKIVGDCLKQMSGEKVAMATMDEQKPADEDKPKFKLKDWVVTDKDEIIQIAAVNIGYYTVNNGMDFNMLYVDKYWRLWTIKDAKDGDVLTCDSKHGQETGIVKKYIGKYGGYDKCFEAYCYVDLDGIFRVGEYIGSRNIHPATKEQRNIFFTRMKEEGWEWNAENKQLNKIES